MKIQRKHFVRGNERGMATVVFIALLAIMVILITANGKALFRLHREIKLVEQQQVKRLNASQTNSVAVTQPDSK
jgi:integral membrane sensor domain MASE1